MKELGIEADTKNTRKYHAIWWMNPRSKENNYGYRFTDAGFNMAIEQLKLKPYHIDVPPNLEWSSGMILRLDRFLDSPYYIKPKTITVFKEKTAVELILYEGDVQKYTMAKLHSHKNNTEST